MKKDFAWQREQELTEIYRRNVSRVYKLCYVYLKNTADAEDAVQSVFLKFLRSEVRFRDGEHEKAWFLTTAQNQCRDVLRSWWKRRRVDLDVLLEQTAREEPEEACALAAALLALPEKYRVVLHLYYLEGYPVKDIADLLGCGESTVRSQLQRGRKKLRVNLGGNEHE